MEGYRVGLNIPAFLKKTWDGDTLVSKQQTDFYGEPFDIGQGVGCGDIDSPVIFNILVVDAIIQDIEARRLKELAIITIFSMRAMESLQIMSPRRCSNWRTTTPSGLLEWD